MSVLSLQTIYSKRITINLFLGVGGFKELFKSFALGEYSTLAGRRLSGAGSKQRGLGVFLFKELLRVEINHGPKPHYDIRGGPINILHTLRSGTTLLTYNTHALYLTFYTLFLFFYYSGGCGASFATLACSQLERDGRALNYLSQYHCGANGLFKNQFSISKISSITGLHQTRYWLTKYKSVDFLFFMDAALSDHLMAILTQIPTHIVGLTTNSTNTFYIDTLLPFDGISVEVQYFFMECALYAYLSGRRAFLKQHVFSAHTLYKH